MADKRFKIKEMKCRPNDFLWDLNKYIKNKIWKNMSIHIICKYMEEDIMMYVYTCLIF